MGAKKLHEPRLPTVDLERLQAGDVLLTAQATFNSWLIRKATKSAYSHAILYVGEGLIIESGPKEGIAFALLNLIKAESIEDKSEYLGRKYWLFATIRGATVIHVYRHASLAKQSLNWEEKLTLMHHVHGVLPDKWGRDYSLLESLGMATPWLRRMPQLKRWLLRTAGKMKADKGKVVPSDFCSELVANVLNDLQLPPFKSSIPGQIPSPQSLADSQISNLCRVPAAEGQPDEGKAADEEHLAAAQQRFMFHVGVHMNDYRKSQLHMKAGLDKVETTLKDLIHRIQKESNKMRDGTQR